METKKPPVFLDLRLIKMPPAALASIGHRASGIFIALLIPFALYLLNLSLSSQEGFNQATLIMESAGAKLALTLVLWASFHHLFAGIRFLFADIHIGVNRKQGRLTALTVLAAAPISAIIVGLLL
jgi:succinate dehydrogenase / fumarate reductase cytochrome b subunit